MAVFITENFDTGPNGAAVAAGTGEAIAQHGTTQTLTYSSSTPITGSYSGRASVTDAASYIYLATRYTAVATAWHTFIYTTGTALNPAQVYLGAVYSGTTKISDVRENTDGTLSIRDCGPTTGGVARYTTPTATPIPRGTRVRVSYATTPGSATGLQLKVYVEGSSGFPTTATYDSGTLSSTSTLTTSSEAHTGITVALSATVAYAFAVQFDSIICSDTEPAAPTVNALPGAPSSTNTTPPTVTMSADQTIYPSGTATGPTVTVTATATAASGATISSYNWRVLAAGAISIVPNGSTATFVAPVLTRDAGYQIGVVAVDNGGLASPEAVTNVTVVATTEWHNNNGVLVPMAIVNADGTVNAPTPPPTPPTIGTTAGLFGVNAAGADFGDGRATVNGTYDSDASFAFYAARGHKTVRIPFLWERIQPTLNTALNTTELNRLTAAVNSATTRGLVAVIDVHNYARYKTTDGVNHVLGDGFLTNSHLTDLWTRLAGAFSSNNLVQFGLMNEPHDLPGTSGAYTVAQNRYLFAGSTQGWTDEATTSPGTVATSTVARNGTSPTSIIVTKAPSTATSYWNARWQSPAPIGDWSAGGLTLSTWVYCPTGANGWQAYVVAQSGGASTPAYADIKAATATPLTAGAWTQLTYTLTATQAKDINRVLVQIESNAPGSTAAISFNISEVTTGSLAGALSPAKQWEAAAQACVTAIRAANATNWIWVPGIAYTAARSFWVNHPTWWINDSAGKSGPEGHHYFDGDRSGTYTQSYATVNSAAVAAGYANLAAQNTAELKLFTDGCKSRGLSGLLGEYGWTNTGGADQANWNAAGKAGYDLLRAAPNISVTHWAAGEQWGTGYNLSVYTGTPQATLTSIASTVETPAVPVSSTAMPTANIPATSSSPGWRFIYGEDFTRGDVPVGSFPGVYANTFDINYADGTKDTAGQSGSPSRYYPSKVLSVTGGVLDMYLHTEAGTPMGAAPAPKLAAGNQWPYNSQTYGRYAVRYRADSLAGFKTAWLLWPDSGVWPGDGEIDYPEGDLGSSSTIGAFAHYASAGGGQDGFDSGKSATSWHIAVTEWAPGSLKFYLDGVLIGTSTTSVPSKPMHYIMQTEACLPTCPLPATAGHLQVDWIAIWAKV